MAVDVNGEREGGEFFRSYIGLRQRDPLSPISFNLVGKALSTMLITAQRNCEITGLVPNLVPGGVTRLQYADDTLLFLALEDGNIRVIKTILVCYEAMSGMKINYGKSEVFVMEVDVEEKQRLVDLPHCKIGQLPIKYLGLPVSNIKLTKAQLNFVNEKMVRRLRSQDMEK